MLKITEEGAWFRSYIDGVKHCVTPEISIQTQRSLWADLILAFDECAPHHVDKSYTAKSMNRSHRWELRSLEEFKRSDNESQALCGILQGGVYEDLRKESANFVAENDFFGQDFRNTKLYNLLLKSKYRCIISDDCSDGQLN